MGLLLLLLLLLLLRLLLRLLLLLLLLGAKKFTVVCKSLVRENFAVNHRESENKSATWKIIRQTSRTYQSPMMLILPLLTHSTMLLLCQRQWPRPCHPPTGTCAGCEQQSTRSHTSPRRESAASRAAPPPSNSCPRVPETRRRASGMF